MSFILDALKKSEADRRRGEVPRLQNEPFSPPPRRRPLWPLLLTLALLLNGAVLGWWLLSREEQPAPVAAAPAGDPVAVAAEPSPRSAGEPSSLEPEVTTVFVVRKPVAAVTPPSGPAPGKTAEKGLTASRAEPLAPARSKAAAPVADSYPPVSELPGDVRSGLPGLDLQLHFFTPVAERRLIRLNGANLREGDRGGDGLSVVEITSDGVKLSYGGVRFFLPTGRP